LWDIPILTYLLDRQQSDESTKTSNEKHQHFVEVLQKVLQILAPQVDCTSSKEKNGQKQVQSDSSEAIAELANIFEYLEVEDPAEWTSDALLMKTSSSSIINSTYQLEPSDEELSFAIFCFLKDLTDIRHYVRQAWAEYREKQIAFTTAAVTMNTAIALFHRLYDDFVRDFPQFDDHGKIINFIYTRYCDPNNERGKDFATYSTSEFRVPSKVFFCDQTFEWLTEFFIESGAEMPFYQPNARITKDEEVLLKCLSLFGFLSTKYMDIYPEDQLIKAIAILRQDKKVYTWVVFAVQLFIDTRRVVGQELQRCMKEFRHLHEWMSTTIKKSLDFGKTNRVNYWYVHFSDEVEKRRKALEMLCLEDFIQLEMEDAFEERISLYQWGPFFLYRNHPMLLGLLTQRNLENLYITGIALGGDQGSIMTAIHLYNSAQQSGLMEKSKSRMPL
jgi:hypothetical protein